MADYGAKFADKKIRKVDRQLQAVYRQAEKELLEQLADFVRKSKAKNEYKQKQLAAGLITEAEYQSWLKGQVFQKERWERKIKSVQKVMHDHNVTAAKIVHENKLDVYTENYLHNAFEMQGISGISFELYSEQAVASLIRDRDQILPEWKIDEKKDYAWNYRKINNAVLQGIIQGQSIDKITKRLAQDLSSQNESKMRMFARTAINQAHNMGKQQQMEDAAKMGIEQLKQWVATLDSRTRDTHRHLDGQEVPYDKPFKSDLGDIMFPSDPTADPANVYNCRCTMITIYPKYRTEQEEWRKTEKVDGLSYNAWKYEHDIKGVLKPATLPDLAVQTYAERKEGSKNTIQHDEPTLLQPQPEEQTPATTSIDISEIPTLQMYNEASDWAKDNFYAELDYLKNAWANVPEQVEALNEFESEIPRYEKIMREAVANNDFSSRTDAEAIIHILEDGRFKSQIETGLSHGVKDIDKRKRVAEQLFAYGERLAIADNEYEIYGYLDKAQRAGMYGNCRVVFKKDRLIDRTTITIGDSLELSETGADPFATLATEPKIFSGGVKQFSDSIPNAKSRLADIRRDFDSIEKTGQLDFGNYVELQFHGGVTLEDIESIQISRQNARAAEVERIAKEKGVKIEWMP